MARKRRASPPPPTPPREEPSSSEEDEEEDAEAIPATQKTPQNPKPPSTAAADADSSDGGGDESSDSEDDSEAFQIREVDRSPAKPSAAASKVESVADEEDGSSSESSVPVQKKAARTPKAEAGKKRQAAESTPSGKAKKAKAEVEKAAPESTLSGKAEKAKAGADKAPSEPDLSRKGKKHKAALPEKAVVEHSPPGKPEKPASRQRWTTEDEIKILEALVSHIKTNGTQPSATDLIAAVGDSLERKNCSKLDMYVKIRKLKQRHEITAKKAASTGTLPGNDDDLRKFSLSEQVWGERANEVASSKSKKVQTNKEKKADDLSKGVAAKEATSTKEKVDRDTKGRLSKNSSTTDTPAKSKKRQNHEEELETDAAKTGTTKETTNTAAQNGGTLVRSNSGKSDKEKKDGDAESLGPKEATTVTQNDDTVTLLKNGETHEEKMDTDPNVKDMHKRFSELQNLYPNLTSYVESIQAQHPCGETLKRAFEFIADEKACALESKIRKQRVAEMKMDVRRADTKKEVTNIFIGLLD